MDTSTERVVNEARERYAWTDATLIGVLVDYLANQDSDEALADYLAERGPGECHDEEPDEGEPTEYDPGPEADDEGGMSEYRHALPGGPF